MKVSKPRFVFNAKFKEIFFSTARYKHLWGGRARGGSHTETDYFLFKITQQKYFRGCFMRSVFGDIAGSLFQDFKDRLEYQAEQGLLNENDFLINETKKTVIYKPTGNSIISKGFKKSSGSQSAKLKSLAGITHVLIEEAEEVDEDDFNKLDDSIRTNKIDNIEIILLFNPPGKNHWIIRRWYNLLAAIGPDGDIVKGWYQAFPKSDPDLLSIHATFNDNRKNLNSKTISKYENYGIATSSNFNEDFFYRDVCGYISEGSKGRIYPNWLPCTNEEFEALPYPSFIGLDFGFSDDPVAAAEIKTHNLTGWARELVYEKGLTNQKLADLLKIKGVTGRIPIYADSAEPKSIQELSDEGLNVLPAPKGPDSVDYGVKKLQGMQWYATENSSNLWLENQEYIFQLDADKNPTNVPRDKFNHIKDGIRYGVTGNELFQGGEKMTGRRN